MEAPSEVEKDRRNQDFAIREGRGPRTSPTRLARPSRALSLAFLLALAGGAAAGDGLDVDATDLDGFGRGSDGVDAPGLPLPPALRRFAFVENLGQWDTPASLVASLGRTLVQVQAGGLVVDARPEGSDRPLRLRLSFEGARDGVAPVGDGPLPGVHSYVLGNDPERWRSGARSFARAVYPGAYEGVDLVLREAGGQLEYDLHLAPGADLAAVVLRVDGAAGLEVDAGGGLLMRSALGTLRQSPPVTWCVLPSGEEEPVECEFVVLDERRFGFRIAAHDAALPVVIDPGLEWATFLGGGNIDYILGMTRTASGNVVVTGVTYSPDFPRSVDVGPTDNAVGGADAFVSILDSSGATLLTSTVIGGTGKDKGAHVQVNAAGEVFVVGLTEAPDFPVTTNGWQTTHGGGPYDGFVLRFPKNLGMPSYASFLGGTDADSATRLTLREPAVVTVAGVTISVDFPAITGTAFQPGFGGDRDFVLCRFDLDQPPAAQLLYGTHLGGSTWEGWGPQNSSMVQTGLHLHEDGAGVVTLCGQSASGDAPVTGDAYQSSSGGLYDAYLARIDPSVAGAGGLLYATFVGGDASDAATALAVDSAGVVTLGGWTYSADFPTTPGAYEEVFVGPSGANDGFVLRLDPSVGPPYDDQLLYSTFLAADGLENVRDVALDANGRIVAVGFTGADDHSSFPATCGAYQTAYGGGSRDGFVAYLDPAGHGVSDLLYSTFVGGSAWDVCAGGLEVVSEDPSLVVLVTGASSSADYPTTSGAFQETHGGADDAVLLQLEVNPHTYCHAEGNSANPDGAIICGAGSVVIADNDLTLSATGLPNKRFGYFLMSATQAFVPNMGGGNGNLCLGAPQIRFSKNVLNSGTAGQMSFQPDLTNLPQGTVVHPGEQWYFQLWYRDVDPTQTSNTSNGLAVTLH